MKNLKVFYGCIIIVCIIAIISVLIIAFTSKMEKPTEKPTVNLKELVADFDNDFTNQIYYQNKKVENMQKIEDKKDLIYTGYEKNNKNNIYDIKVAIPKININKNSANKINEQIEDIFQEKAEDIISNTIKSTIYTVNYKAYINDNILSLVIKATLKEGNSPQRVILKTYHYNLSTDMQIGILEILQVKNLSIENVQERIDKTIEEASKQAEELKNIGYTIYERNLESDIYKVEKTQEFFLGKNNVLYLIYPYGNLNYTSEFDIVVFE